jgi:hypothetical protein
MIDRDKDPCASKQQGVASQHQVTRRGIKKSSKRHDDFMKAQFRSRIAGRVTRSLRALVWRTLLLAGRILFSGISASISPGNEAEVEFKGRPSHGLRLLSQQHGGVPLRRNSHCQR